MHSRNATIVCLKPIVSIEAPDGNESPGRRFSRKNHGRAHSTVGVSFSAYDSQSTKELRTPHAARESNEDAECFSVVLGAGVGFDSLEYTNHNREDDDFSCRADCKGDVRYAITGNRLEVSMFVRAVK